MVREQPAGDAVFFGAFVEVSDDSGNSITYRIVGLDETDAKSSAISMDSPLAKALHKKCVDDEVDVTIGEQKKTLTILSIHY